MASIAAPAGFTGVGWAKLSRGIVQATGHYQGRPWAAYRFVHGSGWLIDPYDPSAPGFTLDEKKAIARLCQKGWRAAARLGKSGPAGPVWLTRLPSPDRKPAEKSRGSNRIEIQEATPAAAAGLCNGKPFKAVWTSPDGAIPGYGKWRIENIDDFTFAERVAVSQKIRAALGQKRVHVWSNG